MIMRIFSLLKFEEFCLLDFVILYLEWVFKNLEYEFYGWENIFFCIVLFSEEGLFRYNEIFNIYYVKNESWLWGIFLEV